MMYGYYNTFNSGFFPFPMFGFIFMFLFWGFIIYIGVLLFHKLSDGSAGKKGDAIEILKERYAKGEISKEQFESMRKDLQ